jgi:sodium-coupled monocarboxylate transporter 8/12
MLGLFFLGMFTKRANTKGALIGCLAGFVAVLALYLQELYVSSLPAEAAGGQKPWVSFLWYTMIGTFITMGVGWLTSSRSASPSVPHQSP